MTSLQRAYAPAYVFWGASYVGTYVFTPHNVIRWTLVFVFTTGFFLMASYVYIDTHTHTHIYI